jgi:hypothetical protein
MEMSLSSQRSSSQIRRSPFSSGYASQFTLPNSIVAAMASRAAWLMACVV